MNHAIDSASWVELSTRFVEDSILIVPLGSTEQHGPHLPLATDTIIAAAWAEALAAAIEVQPPGNGRLARALVAPALPFGAAGEHQSFTGTLSIGVEVTAAVVTELARSATEHVGRIVFLSGHAGNAEPLHRAVELLRSEGRRVDAVLPVLPGADAHAGRTETSLMLHIAPELVSLEAAEAGNTDDLAALMPAMRAGGVAAVSANGVLGDPTGASAAEGEASLQRLVQHALASIWPNRTSPPHD